MQLARVVGTVVTTTKDAQLANIKLLVVQPLTPEREPAGRPLAAVDSVGAGVGEEVFFVRGKEASFPFYPSEPPADAGIVGIVDTWTGERMDTRLPMQIAGDGHRGPRRSTGSSRAPS